VRSRTMRRVHGSCKRPARRLMSEPGVDARWRRSHDYRGPGHA
jgi:hypothetical protein